MSASPLSPSPTAPLPLKRQYKRVDCRADMSKIVGQTFKRLKESETKESVEPNPLSVVTVWVLQHPLELSLEPFKIKRCAINALTSSDEELLNWSDSYNQGWRELLNMSPEEALRYYRDRDLWSPLLDENLQDVPGYYAILEIGEVLSEKGNIVGTFQVGRIYCVVQGVRAPRAHWIMWSAQYQRPEG